MLKLGRVEIIIAALVNNRGRGDNFQEKIDCDATDFLAVCHNAPQRRFLQHPLDGEKSILLRACFCRQCDKWKSSTAGILISQYKTPPAVVK